MKRISIDPMVQFYIGAIVTVFTVFANIDPSHYPQGIPHEWGPILLSWDQFLLMFYTPLAAYFGLIASSTPGPLAPADPHIVVVAQKQAAAEDAAIQAGVPPPPPLLVPTSAAPPAPFTWPAKTA